MMRGFEHHSALTREQGLGKLVTLQCVDENSATPEHYCYHVVLPFTQWP